MDLLEVLDVCVPVFPFFEGLPKVAAHGLGSELLGTLGRRFEDLDVLFGGAVHAQLLGTVALGSYRGGCEPELGNLRSRIPHHPWGQAQR